MIYRPLVQDIGNKVTAIINPDTSGCFSVMLQLIQNHSYFLPSVVLSDLNPMAFPDKIIVYI